MTKLLTKILLSLLVLTVCDGDDSQLLPDKVFISVVKLTEKIDIYVFANVDQLFD